jgi:hypothetical protein
MKNIIKKTGAIATASLLTLAFVSTGFAADDDAKKGEKKAGGKRPAPEEQYAKADADSDGKLTLAEYKADVAKSKRPKKPTDEQLEKYYKKMDKDSNSEVSKEEFVAAAKERAEKGGKGGKGGDKKPGGKPGKKKDNA